MAANTQLDDAILHRCSNVIMRKDVRHVRETTPWPIESGKIWYKVNQEQESQKYYVYRRFSPGMRSRSITISTVNGNEDIK